MPAGHLSDLDVSGDDLGKFWAENFKDISHDVGSWIENVEKTTNCRKSGDFSVERLMKLNKDILAKLLFEGYRSASSYIGFIDDARTQVENLKSELIESHRSQIKLQQNLLEVQSEQIKSVSTVIDTAIENGMKSYSQVVTNSVSKPEPNFTEAKLKKVIQEAVADEDRSKNIMVFGMSEEAEEDVSDKITAVFEEISEKPRFEAARIGR